MCTPHSRGRSAYHSRVGRPNPPGASSGSKARAATALPPLGCPAPGQRRPLVVSGISPASLRQLGDVGGDAPGIVTGEEAHRRVPAASGEQLRAVGLLAGVYALRATRGVKLNKVVPTAFFAATARSLDPSRQRRRSNHAARTFEKIDRRCAER
jgi:hypothetical protein